MMNSEDVYLRLSYAEDKLPLLWKTNDGPGWWSEESMLRLHQKAQNRAEQDKGKEEEATQVAC